MNLRHVLSIILATTAFAIPALGDEPSLHAIAVKGSAGPIIDLNADFWKAASAVAVSTQPQTIANPQNPSPAIGELSVRAAHNGQWLAYLIEWADPTKSDRIVVDQFGDQVAVEMPVKFAPGDSPNPMMGAPGERVNIMQWRAAFQHDIDTNAVDGPKPKTFTPICTWTYIPTRCCG